MTWIPLRARGAWNRKSLLYNAPLAAYRVQSSILVHGSFSVVEVTLSRNHKLANAVTITHSRAFQ
ncbi:hypothetical protein E2C01_031788 [Portunus trituberculatus]|uniref:Uncharacterized protein n=1 Tax=Portunus trituberculatus TaxID=210409 RepID=A0A5B7EVN5_PORTR|nr:hypothetical protein [Portunus trituberculatus]